jgi:purine-binding chemotaxis protein CheW
VCPAGEWNPRERFKKNRAMTTEKKADTTQQKSNTTFQVVVFKLGEEEYGLHIDQIKEVVLTPPVTRMPQTPTFIRGVANIRGNIIAIVDLEEKFGLEKSETTGSNFTLVIESDEFKMGVLVKEVPNTLSISSADIEESVFTGDQGAEQSCFKGIVKLGKRLIIMIDIFKVIAEKDLSVLKKKPTPAEA